MGAYGRDYKRARAKLLEGNPPCWKCGAPSTTADHFPPVALVGPHLNLRPACARCNFGDGARLRHSEEAKRRRASKWKRRWV